MKLRCLTHWPILRRVGNKGAVSSASRIRCGSWHAYSGSGTRFLTHGVHQGCVVPACSCSSASSGAVSSASESDLKAPHIRCSKNPRPPSSSRRSATDCSTYPMDHACCDQTSSRPTFADMIPVAFFGTNALIESVSYQSSARCLLTATGCHLRQHDLRRKIAVNHLALLM